MKLREFLLMCITSPARAFRAGRGLFLAASITMGVLATLPGNYFIGFGNIDGPGAAVLFGILASLSLLLIEAAVYHGAGRVLFTTRASYTQFLSIYGFTALPTALTALSVTAALSLKLVNFWPEESPGLFTFSDPWFVGLLIFVYLMALARLLYIGQALDAVYSIRWSRALPTLVVGMVFIQLVVSPLAASLLNTAQISMGSVPLAMSGVRFIEAPSGLITVPYKQAAWVKGEVLLARIGPTTIRGLASSAVGLRSHYLLVELVALGEERVAIRDGSIWVNGELLYSPQTPLTQLNLAERTLGANEVLVYVTSPEALGTLVSAEQFVISRDAVLGTPRQAILSLINWVAKDTGGVTK